MTDNMENTEDEIEKTLNSLTSIKRAEPQPFFYTRLKARMENAQASMPPRTRWLMQPAVVFGTLGVIFILNIVSIINYSKSRNSEPTVNSHTIEGFVSEYELTEQ